MASELSDDGHQGPPNTSQTPFVASVSTSTEANKTGSADAQTRAMIVGDDVLLHKM
jgi:hypothetical protein